MSVWYVVTKRETCPDCSGFGKVILYEEAVTMPNGGISRPAKPSNEWPICKRCKGNGYTEEQIDLREALLQIMAEDLRRDNL